MDDLLDNFTSHDLNSPAEEGYKYHFVDGSTAGSEHETSIHPAAAASRGPNKDNPFFSTGSHPTTDGESEDDGEYNADVDDDDDDDDEHPHDEASPDEAFHKDSIYESSFHEKPLPEKESGVLDRSSHGPGYGAFSTHDTINQYAEPSLASSDDEKVGSNGFAPRLRRLHRQDMERDDFLKVRILPLKRFTKIEIQSTLTLSVSDPFSVPVLWATNPLESSKVEAKSPISASRSPFSTFSP